MPLDVAGTLAELVAIPSLNPMGRSIGGPDFFERRLTDYLEQLFRRLNWPFERQPIAPDRENILARLDGAIPPERGGPLVMFEAHQDTMPVDGMTIAPFAAERRDGRLYGRGACDVKGGMAAMLGAIARLAELSPGQRPSVLMACTVNEEYGFSGAMGLCQRWAGAPRSAASTSTAATVSTVTPSLLAPHRPDAAIVAEPTRLQIVVAHKGVVRWRCRTTGRAAHSSQPELGDNAIYRMARVVAALEEYHREILSAAGRHPLCGGPTLSVGTISGGISVNTVPGHCVIEIDRRLAPGESPLEARRQVIQYVAARCDAAKIVHDEPFIISPGLSDEHSGQLIERLATAATLVPGAGSRVGAPYGTDAAIISASGVPTVVFGPGSIDQAHTADEWIELAQLDAASEILFEFGRQWR